MKWGFIGFLGGFLTLMIGMYMYPIVSSPFLSSLKKGSFMIRDVYIPLTNLENTEENFTKEAYCSIPAPSRIVLLFGIKILIISSVVYNHILFLCECEPKKRIFSYTELYEKLWCGSLYESRRGGRGYVSIPQNMMMVGGLIEEAIIVDKNYFILSVPTMTDAEIDIASLPECEPNLK